AVPSPPFLEPEDKGESREVLSATAATVRSRLESPVGFAARARLRRALPPAVQAGRKSSPEHKEYARRPVRRIRRGSAAPVPARCNRAHCTRDPDCRARGHDAAPAALLVPVLQSFGTDRPVRSTPVPI